MTTLPKWLPPLNPSDVREVEESYTPEEYEDVLKHSLAGRIALELWDDNISWDVETVQLHVKAIERALKNERKQMGGA